MSGVWYLPDFYLPNMNCYFEVKGTADYDLAMLKSFAQLIKKPLIVAEGNIPGPEDLNCDKTIGLQLFNSAKSEDPDDFIDDVAYGYKDMFLRCDGCGTIKVMNENYSTIKDSCSCGDRNARLMPLSDALEAAKSARFEHKDSQSR